MRTKKIIKNNKKLYCFIFSLLFSVASIADDGIIRIEDARVNPTVKGMKVSAGYFRLYNQTSNNRVLLRVNSNIAETIQIHEHTMKDGLMRMQEVLGGIHIDAGKSIEFKPSGFHLMLMNIEDGIPKNSAIPLTFYFDDGSSQTITAIAK
jgi:periplasmic copper chaperone A